jgi:hypothetical protein
MAGGFGGLHVGVDRIGLPDRFGEEPQSTSIDRQSRGGQRGSDNSGVNRHDQPTFS